MSWKTVVVRKVGRYIVSNSKLSSLNTMDDDHLVVAVVMLMCVNIRHICKNSSDL